MGRVAKVVECIKKYKPEKIILFGSYARGEIDEYGDTERLNLVVKGCCSLWGVEKFLIHGLEKLCFMKNWKPEKSSVWLVKDIAKLA